MDNLKALADGEYDNVAGLLAGINTEGQDLLGYLGKFPKEKQAKILKALLKKKHAPWGYGNSRHEMEQKFEQLPVEILKGLLNKRLQCVDTRFYVTKAIAGLSSIDIFIGTDPKAVTIGNLAQQKLEKDNWLLIYSITMRYGESAVSVSVADFGVIPAVIANGELELQAGNKQLFGPMENSVFDTRGRNDVPVGYYKLDNTKLIEPQVEIKMPVKWVTAAAANSYLRVTFIGTSIIPY